MDSEKVDNLAAGNVSSMIARTHTCPHALQLQPPVNLQQQQQTKVQQTTEVKRTSTVHPCEPNCTVHIGAAVTRCMDRDSFARFLCNSTVQALSFDVARLICDYAEECLFLITGLERTRYLGSVWFFNPCDPLSQAPTMGWSCLSIDAAICAKTVFQHKAVIASGVSAVCGFRRVYSFDPQLEQITELAPMLKSRFFKNGGLFAIDGKLFAASATTDQTEQDAQRRGVDSSCCRAFSVEKYDPVADRWTLISEVQCARGSSWSTCCVAD